jgi:hypothetical protein
MQRSQLLWLMESDRNTKKFHNKAASRGKKNKIKLLKKDNRKITKDRKEMGNMAKEFFQQLYMTDPVVCPQELLHLVEPIISEDI